MKEYDPRLDRLATVLLVRGFALLAFAAIALRWPQQTLADAVRYAGGVAVFLGIVELGIAFAGQSLWSVRGFRVGHAVLSISFGTVGGIVAGQPLERGLFMAALWLGAYTIFLLLLAARLPFTHRIQNALLIWSLLSLEWWVRTFLDRSDPAPIERSMEATGADSRAGAA